LISDRLKNQINSNENIPKTPTLATVSIHLGHSDTDECLHILET
jgi:hypothetical protein